MTEAIKDSTATSRHGAGRGLVGSLAAVFALGPFSLDTYLPALPAIGRTLGATTAVAQLTLPVFMFGMGAGQLLFGPLSDRYGRRIPLLAGLILYVLACIGCALSTDATQLIGFRLVQGLGTCAGQVITMALLADLYEPGEMARISSRLMLVGGVAPLIAPLLGGYLLGAWGWQAIFWALACYGVIVLLASSALVPETRGHALQLRARGESSYRGYWQIARNSRLLRLGMIAALGMAALATYLANASAVLIEQFGVSPQNFGWYFAVNVIAILAGSQVNRTLLAGHDAGRVLRWGLVYFSAATLLLLGASLSGSTLHWPVLLTLFLSLGGVTVLMTNAMALAQGEDRARAGSVAAVLGVLQAAAAVLAASVSSLLYSGTATPMAATMALCAVAALGLYLTLPRAPRPAG